MSPKTFLLSALLAGLSLADTLPASAPATTVTPVYLAVGPQSLVASVVSAVPSSTHYSFDCAPGTDGTNCDFFGRGGNLTVTNANTYIMSVNGAAAGTPQNNLLVACTSYGVSSVVCAENQNSIVSGVASSMSVLFTQNTFQMIPLTVTAGVAELVAAATATPTTATRTSPSATITAGATSSAKAKNGAGVLATGGVLAGLGAVVALFL